jgi:hypothetical protein
VKIITELEKCVSTALDMFCSSSPYI